MDSAVVVPAWCLVRKGISDSVRCPVCDASAATRDARTQSFAAHVAACASGAPRAVAALAAAVAHAGTRLSDVNEIFADRAYLRVVADSGGVVLPADLALTLSP